MLGDRSADTARALVRDLSERLAHRVQLTTDGLPHYKVAVERAFGADVDYAMLDKVYATPVDGQKRYSPPECVGANKKRMMGNPDMAHASTSYAERMNLNIRMGLRRFTRLTNAFSKKVENNFFALAIYFMHYNFARQHQTLRVSPAMVAGVTDKLWDAADIIRMADEITSNANTIRK